MEFVVDSPKQIAVSPPGKAPQKPPPIVVASLNLKTVINHKHNVNEIASAAVMCCQNVKVPHELCPFLFKNCMYFVVKM
jgi:DNA polymerase alpha subunit A